MSEHCIVRVYPSLEDAEAAVKRLSENGFPINRVSIVTKSIVFVAVAWFHHRRRCHHPWSRIRRLDGGLFGLLLGAGICLGARPRSVVCRRAFRGGVAGRHGERVATGATGDGLLSALQGWGVSKEQIMMYEDVICGTSLLIGNGDEPSVRRAATLLDVMAA